MALDIVFPPIQLSKTEEDIVIKILETPAFRKYLQGLASEAAKDLLSASVHKIDKDSLVVAHAVTKATLQVIYTLLTAVPTTKE